MDEHPGSATVSWRQLAPILSVQLMGTLGLSIVLPFLVFLVTDFGGAAWTYGLVGATYSICQLFGAPILGRASDRIGRTRILALSQGGTFAAWVLFLIALSVPTVHLFEFAGARFTLPLVVLFAARALDGLTGGNVSVANAYVADLTVHDPEARQRAFGWMGMAASLGFTVGPAISGLLAATPLGYLAPVSAAAAISAIATILCLQLKEPRSTCPKGSPALRCAPRILGQETEAAAPDTTTRATVRWRPIIIALLVATFVQFVAYSIFQSAFPLHAEAGLGWSPTRLGIFFTVLSLAMIVTEGPLLSALSGRVRSGALFAFGMLSLTACFLVMTHPADLWIFGGAILFALGNGLAWPTFQARIANAADPENQGAVQGAASSAGSMGSIVGLLVGGTFYAVLETNLFYLSAAIFVLVAVATPILFRRSD
ncbi:MAG: MFS transporter [Myxococcota bacterium]